MEENNESTVVENKKKPGKLKKIVIAIVALLVVVAVVLGVLIFTGKLDFNFSKKDKAMAGYDKMSEVVSSVTTSLETEVEEAGLANKLLDKKITEAESSVALSFDINKVTIDGLDSEYEDVLDEVVGLLNELKIKLETKGTSDKAYAKLAVEAGEAVASLEANYDGKVIGVRSPEVNEKWLGLDSEKLLAEIDTEETEELEKMLDDIVALAEDVSFTGEEIEHFKTTYLPILRNFVTGLDVESEKATIEIEDKEKDCTKATITLGEDEIKDLLLTYVEAVEDDDKGIEILKEKVQVINGFLDEYSEIFETAVNTYEDSYSNDYYYDYYYDDYSTSVEDLKIDLDEILNQDNIDLIKEEIENMYLDGIEISIDTYATLTKVYRTDITIEAEGTKIVLECTFNDNNTEILVAMKSSGMSVDLATIIVTNEKNHKAIKAELAKDLAENLGMEMAFVLDCAIDKNKMKTSVKLDLGEEGNISFVNDLTVSENSETAYASTSKNTLKMDIDGIVIDATINLDSKIKTDGVKVDTIDEYVDITNALINGELDEETTKKLQDYVDGSKANVKELLTSLKTIDIIENNLSSEVDELINALG